MRYGLVALAAAALLAGCGTTRTVVRTVTVARPSAQLGTGDQRLYGHIVSLRRTGGGAYLLRFDPLWFVSGVTANVAQAEDERRSCAPTSCPPVANDNYRMDEGHRVLTFLAPATVRGTVLAQAGGGGLRLPGKSVTVAELARLAVAGNDPTLFEPLSSGVWILVRGDTVRSFAQQYVP